MDLEAVYRGVRERTVEVVGDADPATRVPATPDWTVRDVIAHLAGVLADIRDGNLGGVGTDPWTEAQVSARRDRSLPDLIDEWTANAAVVEPRIPDFPEVAAKQLISDAFSHEQDVRGAVGRPGGRDSEAASVSLERFAENLVARAEGEGVALRVEANGEGWGPDDAQVRVCASPFELVRAISGRRSPEQVRSFDWGGDPETVLGVFFQFEPRTAPLRE